MTKDAYLPDYKDQAASVAADRRPSPRTRRTTTAGTNTTKGVSDLPTYKDQVRPSLPSGDPNGTDDSARASLSEASTVLAEPVDPLSSSSGRFPPTRTATGDHTSRSSASATHVPIAFAIAADSINGSSNESSTTDPEQQKQIPWKVAWTILTLMVVAGAVVGGVVCGSGKCSGGGGGTGISVEAAPTAATSSGNSSTPPSPAAAATMPLSPSSTPASPADVGTEPMTPVSSSSSSPVSDVNDPAREQNVTSFINSYSYMDFNLSPTGNSPEELALQWLIYDDPLQLDVAPENELRLLQRYSLMTIWFQSETGTEWIDSTNWTNADECTWHRIVCQPDVGVVVQGVRLYERRLQGTLSPDLGLLSDLTELNLNDNIGLAGSLPSEIGLWTNLESFRVSSSSLTGSLPSEIGLWTNLKVMDAAKAGLTGSLPTEIGLWTSLTSIDVNRNSLVGSLPLEIGGWTTNLTLFNVGFNELIGTLPSGIGLWTNVETFSVAGNNLSGSWPSEIVLWADLEVFSILDNSLTGLLPSAIGQWRNLTNFDISKNRIRGSLPSEIGLWTRLTSFRVLRNNLTGTIPETVSNWTMLEDAWFNGNNFTGSVPDSLCDFIAGQDSLTADCGFPCSCCTKCT